mmetsp:Transcript_25910/g.86264  ORF Transcript_25910/g.86264 Transcript_25910/m.86264 type:complete len:242 (-) Transcript_25910:441-1166(-)
MWSFNVVAGLALRGAEVGGAGPIRSGGIARRRRRRPRPPRRRALRGRTRAARRGRAVVRDVERPIPGLLHIRVELLVPHPYLLQGLRGLSSRDALGLLQLLHVVEQLLVLLLQLPPLFRLVKQQGHAVVLVPLLQGAGRSKTRAGNAIVVRSPHSWHVLIDIARPSRRQQRVRSCRVEERIRETVLWDRLAHTHGLRRRAARRGEHVRAGVPCWRHCRHHAQTRRRGRSRAAWRCRHQARR